MIWVSNLQQLESSFKYTFPLTLCPRPSTLTRAPPQRRPRSNHTICTKSPLGSFGFSLLQATILWVLVLRTDTTRDEENLFVLTKSSDVAHFGYFQSGQRQSVQQSVWVEMGKKRQHIDMSRSIQTSQGLPGPPGPPLPKFQYADMPANHKRKLYITHDCGTAHKYLEVIHWLREMGCAGGTVFSDIRNLNWDSQSYPLVEVEVIASDNRSSKFLILKKTLYLLAFLVMNSDWFQFKSEVDIDVAENLVGSTVRYSKSPWEFVGPKAMLDSLNTLALEAFDDQKPSTHLEAVEVFYVHLCEAARLYPFETYVSRSLYHSLNGRYPNTTTDATEAAIILGDGIVSETDDAYASLRVDGLVNTDSNLQTPPFFKDLLKKHGNLSKFWFAYSLSGGKLDIQDHDLRRFHLRSVKSLKSILAVLAWTNLSKLSDEWAKKVGNQISAAEFTNMRDLIAQLTQDNKIFFSA